MTKLPVLQARLKGLANAARNASCPESVELWEGRVSEIEFIADTTGKRAALAFAKSFYSGKSGFSTAHLIELNKRAKLWSVEWTSPLFVHTTQLTGVKKLCII